MFKAALIGASVVPLIIGANYLNLMHWKAAVIDEATETVGAHVPGVFSGVALPQRGFEVPPPDPFKICGHINSRRFLYDAHTRQFDVDSEPGQACDQTYYPSP